MRTAPRIVAMTVAVLGFAIPAHSQNSPDRQGGPADLPPTAQNGLVTYRTGLQVDIDVAANAYSVDGALGSVAHGGALDHICSGAYVEVATNGALRNKYPHLSHVASAQCLADYRKLRDAGFPACSTGECMSFYGVVATPPSCSIFGGSKDMNCGQPVRQKNPTGR